MTPLPYAQLLDPLPVGACVIGGDLTVLHWNRTLSDWTRLSPEAVVGRRLDVLYPELKDGLVRRRLDQVLAGGPPAIFSAQLHGSVIPARFPTGRPRFSNTTVSLLAGPDEDTPVALLAAEDVTNLMERLDAYETLRGVANRELEERRRVEAQLRSVTDELRRSNRDLNDFATVAAHDLQAPLRQISTWADILLEEDHGLDAAQLRQGLRQIAASSSDMRSLVKSVLTYSRVGIGPRSFVGVDLGDLIAEVVRGMSEEIAEAGATVRYADLPVISGDRPQLSQLFANLLGNAIKFRRPEAPPVVDVVARPSEDGSAWDIEVHDNGIGFEAHRAEEIFEMCRRLHPPSHYAGTGIGLATCRRIVERYGGTISASAQPGAGACFVVRWPACVEDDARVAVG